MYYLQRFLSVLVLCFYVNTVRFVTATKVLHLTDANFQKEVLKSKDIFMVEFYAPWCGHCKALEPNWKKAADILAEKQSKVKLVAVDCTSNPKIAQKYAIKGFPTIKYFGKNKKKPVDYQGPREAAAIAELAQSWEKQVLKGTSKDEEKEKKKQEKKQKKESKKQEKKSNKAQEPPVLDLNDSNFQKRVLESNELFIVEFFAPWCGHCKRLAPEYKKAGQILQEKGSKVKLVAVDCTTNTKIAQKYAIQGYPTLKYFGPNKKKPMDYNGPREADGIVEAALEFERQYGIPPSVDELSEPAVFDENCNEQSLCLIVVLPDILDTGAKGRNDYLNVIKQVAKENKHVSSLKYVWTYAGAQPNIEKTFDLGGSGYPAAVAVSSKKQMYSKYIRAFDSKSISKFMINLKSGRENVVPFQKVPEILTTPIWNGKDGDIPKEEL